jgi:hypothetical protein
MKFLVPAKFLSIILSNKSSQFESYTLSLRDDRDGGGVKALKKIDEELFQDIRAMAAPDGGPNSEVLKFGFGTNADLNPTVRWNRGRNDDTFRITRTNLRNRLVQEVKRVGIQLERNSQAVRAEFDAITKKVVIEMEDGRKDECDLLIGEDEICVRVCDLHCASECFSC